MALDPFSWGEGRRCWGWVESFVAPNPALVWRLAWSSGLLLEARGGGSALWLCTGG